MILNRHDEFNSEYLELLEYRILVIQFIDCTRLELFLWKAGLG